MLSNFINVIMNESNKPFNFPWISQYVLKNYKTDDEVLFVNDKITFEKELVLNFLFLTEKLVKRYFYFIKKNK